MLFECPVRRFRPMAGRNRGTEHSDIFVMFSPNLVGRVASLVEIRKWCNLRVNMVSSDQAARAGATGPAGRGSVCQRSTFRIRIRPEARSARSGMGTVSAQGSRVWAFIRLRNSPLGLSMALVVRAALHCDGSGRENVNRRSPASSRLSAPARHFFLHFPRNALRRRWIPGRPSAGTSSRSSRGSGR